MSAVLACPSKNETRTTVATVAGSTGVTKKQQPESNGREGNIQPQSNPTDRLTSAFNLVGWSLHVLAGGALLAVQRAGKASVCCPDVRAASALLRRVRGR